MKPSRAGGTNYAVGGALTDGGPNDVRGQLAAYLNTHRGRAEVEAKRSITVRRLDVFSLAEQVMSDPL